MQERSSKQGNWDKTMEYICITHLTDKRNIGKFKSEYIKHQFENQHYVSCL